MRITASEEAQGGALIRTGQKSDRSSCVPDEKFFHAKASMIISNKRNINEALNTVCNGPLGCRD